MGKKNYAILIFFFIKSSITILMKSDNSRLFSSASFINFAFISLSTLMIIDSVFIFALYQFVYKCNTFTYACQVFTKILSGQLSGILNNQLFILFTNPKIPVWWNDFPEGHLIAISFVIERLNAVKKTQDERNLKIGLSE